MKRMVLALALVASVAHADGVPQELQIVADTCAQACSAECSVDISSRDIVTLAERSATAGIQRAAVWLYDFCPQADVNAFIEQVNVALRSVEFPTYQACKETKKGLRCKSKRRFVPVNTQP